MREEYKNFGFPALRGASEPSSLIFVKKFKYDYIQKEGNRAILPIFEKILYNRAKN